MHEDHRPRTFVFGKFKNANLLNTWISARNGNPSCVMSQGFHMLMTVKKDGEKFTSVLSASPLEAKLHASNPFLHLKGSYLPPYHYHHLYYHTISECELDFSA